MVRPLLALAWSGSLLITLARVHAEENGQAVGASTNGIYGSATYSPNSYGEGGHLVSVYSHFTPPSTNIDYISQFELEKFHVAKYFVATNSFCGFLELKDSGGNKLPLLKPNVNSQAAYPSSYSLKQVFINLNKGISMGPELPMAITGTDPRICNFHLHRYFQIEKLGDYQLTIWPKIYKRSVTNLDLVERIDLPPVTIPIKWTESSSK